MKRETTADERLSRLFTSKLPHSSHMLRSCVLLALAAVCTHAAVLQSKMPLTVVSITPAGGDDEQQSILLDGRASITVVFSRPVLAIGEDALLPDGTLPAERMPMLLTSGGVPLAGRWRWSTSFIARYDVDGEWPTDLRLSLQRNSELRSFDGLHVTPSTRFDRMSFHTRPLTGYATVHSERAANATASLWSPRAASPQALECPPDAVVTLRFASPVDVNAVASALQLTGDGAPSFSTRACDGGVSAAQADCMQLMPAGLLPASSYDLLLPVGTRYSATSGPLAERIAIRLTGLQPFRFNWLSYRRPSSSVLGFALPHGLRDDVPLSALAAAISFTSAGEQLQFTLSRPVTAVVQAWLPSLQPQQAVTMHIAASSSVRDAFDQPLLADEQSMTTAQLGSVLTAPVEQLLSFPSPLASWQLFTRDWYRDIRLRAWRLTQRRLVSALRSVFSYSSNSDGGLMAEEADVESARYTSGASSGLLHGPSLPTAGTLLPSSAAASGSFMWTSDGQQARVVSQSSMSVAFLAGDGGSVTAWVTQVDGGAAAVGARVQLFHVHRASTATVTVGSESTTDADGLATLSLPDADTGVVVAAITAADADEDAVGQLVFDLPTRTVRSRQPPTAALIADRSIYKPGDVVMLKGWLRQPGTSPQAPTVPSDLSALRLSARWRAASEAAVMDVAASADWGSIAANLTIPSDADYGEVTLSLSQGDWGVLAGTTVLIASPQPPTVKMDMTADSHIDGSAPDCQLAIQLATASYTGVPFANAAVQLRWTVQQPAPPQPQWAWWLPPAQQPPPLDSGVLSVQTNGSGLLQTSLQLCNLSSALPLSPPADGRPPAAFVVVEAEWIGPARELLRDSVSVALTASSWQLSLLPSVREPLPGTAFNVFVALADGGDDGSAIGGVDIAVHLQRSDGSVLQSCSTVSKADGAPSSCALPFTMPPSMQALRLRASAVDSTGVTVWLDMPVGRSAADWQAQPLFAFPGVEMLLDGSSYDVGAQASVLFSNPFANASLWLQWGAGGSTPLRNRVLHSLPAGDIAANFTVDAASCGGGCTVTAVVAAPRASWQQPVAVPSSPLFDSTAPISFMRRLRVRVNKQARPLDASASLASSTVLPGASVDLTIQLPHSAAAGADIAVVVTDAALLALRPAPLPQLAAQLQPAAVERPVRAAATATSQRSALGYSYVASTLLSRLEGNAWYPLYRWPTLPPSMPSGVTASMADSYARLPAALTASGWLQPPAETVQRPLPSFSLGFTTGGSADASVGGGGAGGQPLPVDGPEMLPEMGDDAEAPPAAPPAADASGSERSEEGSSAASGAPAAPSSAAAASLRSDFQSTAVFLADLRLAKGQQSLTVALRMPDNVGTWAVRVVAIDGEGRAGVVETSLVSRRPLSLQSTMPPFLRVGDATFAGALANVLQPLPTAVQLDATVEDDAGDSLLALISGGTAGGEASRTAPVELRVWLAASNSDIGAAALRLAAHAGNDSDAMRVEVPVLAHGLRIYTGSSMVIPASKDGSQWAEGMALPAALAGSGWLNLTAGVGHLPSVLRGAADSCQQLLTAVSSRQSASVSGPMLLSAIAQQQLLATAYALPADDEVALLCGKAADVARDMLPAYLSASRGLQWMPQRGGGTLYVDAYSTARALWMQTELHRLGGSLLTTAQQSKLETALRDELTRRVSHARRHGWVWKNAELLALSWLALGHTGWQPSLHELSMNTLQAQLLPSSGVYCGAMCTAAAALSSQSSTTPAWARSALTRWLDSIRVTARTAYIPRSPSSTAPLGDDAHAMLQLALLRADMGGTQLQAKLAAFLTGEGRRSSLFAGWRGPWATATTALQLATYDRDRGSTAADAELTVRAGDHQLLAAAFHHASAHAAVSSGSRWELLPSPPPPLRFTATGSGEVSVTAGLSFVPLVTPVSPVFHGIYLTRWMQRADADGLPSGQPVQVVAEGTLVWVTLQLTSADQLAAVSVVDLLPAGLQALDDLLFPLPPAAQPPASSRWWGADWTPQARPDRLTWYTPRLPAGTYVLRYRAVARTQGVYIAPAAKAFAVEQPEVYGLSSRAKLAVTEGELGAAAVQALRSEHDFPPTAAELAANARDCEGGCPNGGFCDTVTGSCKCAAAYTIVDGDCEAVDLEEPPKVTTTSSATSTASFPARLAVVMLLLAALLVA
eukprot:PLAT4159.1.p1 GENE.PLAT4159.1~~PLAT4159.1.p1  ORF type:complete len:2166 (-),score=949.07 PLAT4159.1:54-6551(-)